MSDALEAAIKQVVKKAIAEALTETLSEQKQAGASSSLLQFTPPPVVKTTRKKEIMRARAAFACRSLRNAVCACAVCGLLAVTLFAPELARAAVNNEYGYTTPAERAVVQQTPATQRFVDDLPAGCVVEQPGNISWRDLASLDKVEQMVKSGAVLHARPEDMVAIVIFHAFRKLARGDSFRLDRLEEDFRESLPCHWVPAYEAVKAEAPPYVELPPAPRYFAAPRAPR